MNWFFIALAAPVLWAVTVHIDKYLVSRYLKEVGIGTLAIFSALIGLLVLPFILIIEPNVFSLDIKNSGAIIINGIIYVLAIIPFLYALKNDETSIVVPLFQTIPA